MLSRSPPASPTPPPPPPHLTSVQTEKISALPGAMDNGKDLPPGIISSGRMNDADLSRRRRSSMTSTEDLESVSVAEAGDIGDRALSSRRFSRSGGIRVSGDVTMEDEGVPSPSKDTFLNTCGRVPPMLEEIKSHEFIDEVERGTWPKLLEDASCMVYLAAFSILGVLTRYLLQRLFGPGVAGVTGNEAILYLDLPSNMVGSFLMGWLGVVFKQDIFRFSEFLAIGLSTGYLGSLTTFSGWNQKMLDLSVEGKWVFSVLGFITGLFLTSFSIIFGVETANGFRWLIQKSSRDGIEGSRNNGAINSLLLLLMVLMLGSLWAVSAVFLREEFSHGGSIAQLWLACLVGPPGAWMRWYLAKLNGRGLGKNGHLKWLPIGTVTANIFAASLMAALSTVEKVAKKKTCNTVVTGIQFGFLGCLSTVSTFMAEFNAMRQSKNPWRAYVYAFATISVSFGLGILLYDLPLWLKNS